MRQHEPPCDMYSINSSEMWKQRIQSENAHNAYHSPEVRMALERAAEASSGTRKGEAGSVCSGAASTGAWSTASSAINKKIAELERELQVERSRRAEVERALHKMGQTTDSERRRRAEWTGKGLAFRDQS